MITAIEKHNSHLDMFRTAQNGNRNSTLNTQALLSFGLALGNNELSMSKVENDYIDVAKALQMEDNEIKKTLASALNAAIPFTISNGSTPGQTDKPLDKSSLLVAPTYTALEDYAKDHGTPVSAFEKAKWIEGEYLGRKCLKIPHEDDIIRVRFLDGNKPKWQPIKPHDKKDKIVPCWYGFNRAVTMATKAKDKTIVLCNGQPSVITAQHYDIAALAQTDGEDKHIHAPLMKRLKNAIQENGLKVVLAYDGDDTGRSMTDKVMKQLQINKIDVRKVLFGGDDGYDLADYCKQHKIDIMDKLLRLAAFNVGTQSDERKTLTLSDSMDGILGDFQKNKAPGNAVAIPFKSFHKLGGYAYMTAPGKLGMVMGPSGHGKTSFMETWVDMWLRAGIDVLWYSPEWDAMETHWRRIQRNGGATYDQVRELILYRDEKIEGIPEAQRLGKRLSPETLSKTYLVNDTIRNWPGHIFCYKAQRVTETVLDHMSKRLQRQRRDGRRVGVVVFDYMQLMRTQAEVSGKNTYEVIGDMLKDWCVENHIFGLVGMQVKKSSGQTDNLLGMYDAQWVRPDIFNLIVTLNIKEREIFEAGIGTGRMEKDKIATANICKNSTGQLGEIQLETNFRYLAWKDRK
jgi:hypothetical protein